MNVTSLARHRTDPLVRSIEETSEEAVSWVTEEIYRRYSEVFTPFGIKSWHQTQQDLRSHIQFLAASLASSEIDFFPTYVRWIAGISEQRGGTARTLPESLSLLLEFYEGRLSFSAYRRLAAIIDTGLTALNDPAPPPIVRYHELTPLPLPGVEPLTQNLIRGDTAAARSLLIAAGGGDAYLKLATRLVQPSLYSVGHLWEENQITVAQEHLATAVSNTILAQLYLDAEFSQPVQRRAIFACVEENEHSLGLRMVSDAFELSGWSTHYLGANVPVDALQAHIERWRPDLVGLSVALIQHLPRLRATVTMLRNGFPAERPTILVGGLATNMIEEAFRWVGADLWCADAERARQLAIEKATNHLPDLP